MGDFTVLVPAGWAAVPQKAFDDAHAKDGMATNEILISRGAVFDDAKQVWNIARKPYVRVTYLTGDDTDKLRVTKNPLWENVTEIADKTIGSFTWQGYAYKSLGEWTDIWTQNGDYGYRVSVSCEEDVTLDDQDVQAIISSLK